MRKDQHIGRRRFLARMPAAVVAVSPVVSGLASPTVEAAPQGGPSPKLGTGALKSAEQVAQSAEPPQHGGCEPAHQRAVAVGEGGEAGMRGLAG